MPAPPDGGSTPVTLYALQTCSRCRDVKRLLRDKGVPFRTVHVDMLTGEERNDTMRRIRRINPSVSFPTLVVGERTIVGFKKEEIEAALEPLAAAQGKETAPDAPRGP